MNQTGKKGQDRVYGPVSAETLAIIGDAHLKGFRLFTDGTAHRANPSPIGGAGGYILVDPSDTELDRGVLAVIPDDFEAMRRKAASSRTVHNMLTEPLGINLGLEALVKLGSRITGGLPTIVTVCSDCEVALKWLTGEYDRTGMGKDLSENLARLVWQVQAQGITLQTCLLAGHPIQRDRNRGYKIKKLKSGKEIWYPVHILNEECDDLCRAAARERFGE